MLGWLKRLMHPRPKPFEVRLLSADGELEWHGDADGRTVYAADGDYDRRADSRLDEAFHRNRRWMR